jgi:hypothetical protein
MNSIQSVSIAGSNININSVGSGVQITSRDGRNVITVNGKQYPTGNSVSVQNGVVYIDGKIAQPLDKEEPKPKLKPQPRHVRHKPNRPKPHNPVSETITPNPNLSIEDRVKNIAEKVNPSLPILLGKELSPAEYSVLNEIYVSLGRPKNDKFYFEVTPTETTILTIKHTALSDISPLSKMEYLLCLDLSCNNISSISQLAANYRLICLEVPYNPISSIESVRNLKELIHLNIAGTKVLDLSPLSSLPNFTELNIGGISSISLSPLYNSAVRKLIIESTPYNEKEAEELKNNSKEIDKITYCRTINYEKGYPLQKRVREWTRS